MPISQNHISSNTPMGANVVANGSTFRVWAPDAKAVYVNGVFGGMNLFRKDTDPGLLLQKHSDGRWTGFLDGVQEGDRYKFYVVGKGANGFKRDPYARELTTPADFPGTFGFPSCDCIVRDPTKYTWRSEGFRPPDFHDLIVYQFHIGVFSGPDSKRRQCEGTFLDALDKVEHLARLGVNAIEPLPIDEAGADKSVGYDGRDFFSPEMSFGVPDAALTPYLQRVNALFAAKSKPGVSLNDLVGSMAQLKVMIDVFHLYGIAVLLDVVYNHAGPFGGDDECLYFFDLRAAPSAPNKNNNDSLYFTDQGVAEGLAFAYWNRQELVALRKRHSALRGEYCRVALARDNDRVLVMHRWLEGVGRDIIVVASLNERTFNEPNYRLGFPQGGRWLEVFNSDVYDDIGQRTPFGNGGAIVADGDPPWMDSSSQPASSCPPTPYSSLPATEAISKRRCRGASALCRSYSA